MAEYIEFDKDHHAHHHKETFITKYIFSQDHKMIAKQYLFTGVFFTVSYTHLTLPTILLV